MTSHQLHGFRPPEEGGLVAVDVDGTAVAVSVTDGELHAFDDTCTHAGCSLAEGELDGHIVTCPCHLSRFDVRTGAVLDGPAPSGVTSWAATVRDGTVELTPRRAPDGDANTAGSSHAGPSGPATGQGAASPGTDLDIVAIIEREHAALRRQFDALAKRPAPRELGEAWEVLADLLEVHASGEEAVLYPTLVQAAEDGVEETDHAVRDHNEIRDSVRRVRDERVGTEAWWAAVHTAQEVNEAHLQEEERDVLPSMRDSLDRTRREHLGQRWLDFFDEHNRARGLSHRDTNPQEVVQRQPQ